MIIVQLSGGFGNQLFQYAAGLSLAAHHNVNVKVDISLLNKKDPITGTMRQLDIFNLAHPPEEASKKELDFFTHESILTKYLEKRKPFFKRKIYKERSTLFDVNFFSAGNNLLLKGNRQSEKYFKRFQDKIKSEFILSTKCITSVEDLAQRLRNENSVSIHIRRGDYLTPIALEWLGVLPISYYSNAIARMSENRPTSKFYIFSDDIEWTKANLLIDYEHEFVSGLITKSPMEDFYLMSQCKHNVIANSTFSWWAAWLNPNPDKTVIAPKNWYNQVNLNTSDLIPDEWIRLQ